MTRAIRIAVANLAGVPSIVFGLFGLGFFVQFVGAGIDKTFFHGEKVYGQPALIWAALTLAVLTLPVVIVATEEALRAVPRELREASLALGATKFQTVFNVVVPQASSGILTGTILAVSRGAGEVAPILFTGAAYFLPHLPKSLSSQFMRRLSRLRALDAVARRRRDQADPLRHGAGAAGADLHPQHRGGRGARPLCAAAPRSSSMSANPPTFANRARAQDCVVRDLDRLLRRQEGAWARWASTSSASTSPR